MVSSKVLFCLTYFMLTSITLDKTCTILYLVSRKFLSNMKFDRSIIRKIPVINMKTGTKKPEPLKIQPGISLNKKSKTLSAQTHFP